MLIPFVYICTLAFFMFLLDRKLLKRASLKDRVVYGSILAVAVYLSVIFLNDLEAFNLHHLIALIFEKPANLIVNMVKS